jgi:hypothetical protein
MENKVIILMVVFSKVTTFMFVMMQTSAMMLSLFAFFMALRSSFALLQPGCCEGGVTLGVMHVVLSTYTPSLVKLLQSPKLCFCFIGDFIFFVTSDKFAH